eukprot:3370570-Ditylum_brightwellii.AAC.3
MVTPGEEFKEEVDSQVVSQEGGVKVPPPDFDLVEPIFADKPVIQVPVAMASTPAEALLGAKRLTNQHTVEGLHAIKCN